MSQRVSRKVPVLSCRTSDRVYELLVEAVNYLRNGRPMVQVFADNITVRDNLAKEAAPYLFKYLALPNEKFTVEIAPDVAILGANSRPSPLVTIKRKIKSRK
jgi:hypothetical protein